MKNKDILPLPAGELLMESDLELPADNFLASVFTSLSSTPKYLESKYFYDAAGDKLFQEIMHSEEYYPFNCEQEIFENHGKDLAEQILSEGNTFDLIELGAGDCHKSVHLIRHLLSANADFDYLPVDISANVIQDLEGRLPGILPNLKIHGYQGDYFSQLEAIYMRPSRRRVILFLGSNIGNMTVVKAMDFCRRTRSILSAGDLFIVGIDLKKNPVTILSAYNDKGGVTSAFNLNLLARINRELAGNIDLDSFLHYPTYDPQTGSCKSFLVSTVEQVLKIHGQEFHLDKDECIFTEISQKYTNAEIDELAEASSFTLVKRFFDTQRWFTEVIWKAV